jgi:hypothetical protein
MTPSLQAVSALISGSPCSPYSASRVCVSFAPIAAGRSYTRSFEPRESTKNLRRSVDVSHHSHNCSSSRSGWLSSRLATQQELGILPEWRRGPYPPDSSDPFVDGPDLVPCRARFCAEEGNEPEKISHRTEPAAKMAGSLSGSLFRRGGVHFEPTRARCFRISRQRLHHPRAADGFYPPRVHSQTVQ